MGDAIYPIPSDKGLISKIYRLLIKLKGNTYNPSKVGRTMNSHFLKEEVQMFKRHMKNVSHH